MFKGTHFSIADFHCKSGAPYPEEWIDSRLNPLVNILDQIRDAWGGPIIVVSGYRDPEYNRMLYELSIKRNNGVSGVAKDSKHMEGIAADIAPPRTSPDRVLKLHKLVKSLRAAGQIRELGGLGLYPHWIHVDTRVTDKLVEWGKQ